MQVAQNLNLELGELTRFDQTVNNGGEDIEREQIRSSSEVCANKHTPMTPNQMFDEGFVLST